MGLLSTLFGKRRKRTKRTKKSKRPSAALRKLCKKLGVKITLKRGHRRVYKSIRQLKKQCHSKLKARKSHFGRRRCRAGYTRRHTRRGRGRCCRGVGTRLKCHGGLLYTKSRLARRDRRASLRRRARAARRYYGFGSSFGGLSPASLYSQKVISPGAPGYSSQYNSGKGLYGTAKPFFNTEVPQALPPSWYYNLQPNGSKVMVGSPFSSYKTPINRYI